MICAFLYLKPIGRMKRSNLGALRVKSGPTKVGFVTTRFHAFLAVFFPVLTTLNISSSAMPLTLGSGTLNLAAFSARLFLICVDSAFAFVGFALSSRYEGIGFAGSFSAAAPLTLRSSCALIVFRSWIFSWWRFLAYSLALRPRRFCAFSEALCPSRAAFLRVRSSWSRRRPCCLIERSIYSF